MFNLRISLIVASLAFVLSFFIGILFRSSFPAMVLRPLVFGVFFFLFSGFVSLIVSRFLPELLDDDAGEPQLIIPGSRINISEETPAVPGMAYARPDDSDEELGDITNMMAGAAKASDSDSDDDEEAPTRPGMDQTAQAGYTKQAELGSPDRGESFDSLPDLESLVGAFLPSSGEEEEEVQEYSSSEPAKRQFVGNKPQKMDVDFNPKELAAGIRTVLKKDEG